jgi:hypothetical protein
MPLGIIIIQHCPSEPVTKPYEVEISALSILAGEFEALLKCGVIDYLKI